MKKKTGIILLALLAVIVCIGGGMLYKVNRDYKQLLAEQQEKDEQEEIQQKMEEQQKRLEESREEKEQQQALESEQEEAQAEEESAQEEETTDLEQEAQIHRPAAAEGPVEGMEDLRQQLEGMISAYEGDWSVYVCDLMGEEYLEINSHPVKAASLIKLYIMGAVLEQVEAGNLTDDDSLNQLLTAMITVSDNESSNELVRRLSPDGTNHEEGMKVVNAFAQAYGYEDTSQGRDLRDFREVPAEGENYTSVKDCGLYLRRVYEGECVSPEASARILNLLKQQTRTWKIPAGVPDGIVTANKTGELSDTENDVAIVYAPGGDYVLCVTSTGIPNPGTAQSNIVNISSTVYQYFSGE